MLTRFKTRRLAAVLVLASVTNAAGFVAAQQPVRGSGRTAPVKPTLLSDCDVTQTSCGGDPVLGGGVYGGGGGTGGSGGGTDDCCAPSGGGQAVCWSGTSKQCGKDSTTICVQWSTSGGGSVGVNTGGTTAGGSVSGTYTQTCTGSTTTVRYYYWSK